MPPPPGARGAALGSPSKVRGGRATAAPSGRRFPGGLHGPRVRPRSHSFSSPRPRWVPAAQQTEDTAPSPVSRFPEDCSSLLTSAATVPGQVENLCTGRRTWLLWANRGKRVNRPTPRAAIVRGEEARGERAPDFCACVLRRNEWKAKRVKLDERSGRLYKKFSWVPNTNAWAFIHVLSPISHSSLKEDLQ